MFENLRFAIPKVYSRQIQRRFWFGVLKERPQTFSRLRVMLQINMRETSARGIQQLRLKSRMMFL